MDADEKARADGRPHAGELPRPLAFLLVLAAWLLFGFLFGWHWLVLFLVSARSQTERRTCLVHWLVHVAALVITAVGGGWCRSSGTYIPCADNQTMTRICLMETQPLDYRIIYIMHFVSGGALLAMGVLDIVQLPGWTLQRCPLAALYSPYSLAPAYGLVLAVATTAVTITWTAIFAWDDWNLNELLNILLLVIVAVGALGAIALRLLAMRFAGSSSARALYQNGK